MILEESCLSRIPLFLYIGALFYERVTTGTGHIAWIFELQYLQDRYCLHCRSQHKAGRQRLILMHYLQQQHLCV